MDMIDGLRGPIETAGPPAREYQRTSEFTRSREAFRFAITLHVVLCVAIGIVLSGLYALGIAKNDLILLGTIAAILLMAESVLTWRVVGGIWFSLYFLTMVAAYMFHGGQYLLNLFGIETNLLDGPFNIFRFSDDTLWESLVLILLGLGGFHLGALLAALLISTDHSEQDEVSTESMANCRLVGWLLLAISIVPSLMILQNQVALRLSGTYHDVWALQEQKNGLSNWVSVLGGALTPGLLFLVAGSKGKPFSLSVATGCLGIQFIGLIIVGDRSGAIMPLLGYGWVFHHCVQKVSRKVVRIAAVAMLILIPVVAQLRQISVDEMSSIDISTQHNPLVSLLNETGVTALVVCDTVELVPWTRPHAQGLGYLEACLGNFNFLIPVNLTGYSESYVWLVETRYPERLANNQYLGFSFIAEAYLEFGWIGTPIMLAIFGAAFVWLEYWALGQLKPERIAVVGAILYILPHFTRGQFGELARPGFRYSILPYLLLLAVGYWKASKQLGRVTTGDGLSRQQPGVSREVVA